MRIPVSEGVHRCVCACVRACASANAFLSVRLCEGVSECRCVLVCVRVRGSVSECTRVCVCGVCA